MVTIDEIKYNADAILADDEKMKEVIQDPKLVIQLLETKKVYNLKITVDGEDFGLVRSIEPPI